MITGPPPKFHEIRDILQQHLERVLQQIVGRLPVDPGGLHRHVRHPGRGQPLPQIQQIRGRGPEGPDLLAHLAVVIDHPHAHHQQCLPRHRSPRTDRSTCASPTPSPSAPAGCALAWGLPNQTNLLHVLQGNSPGCRPTPATRLQNGLTGTKGRPASSRAHPPFPPATGGAEDHGDFRDECLAASVSGQSASSLPSSVGSDRSARSCDWPSGGVRYLMSRAGLPATTA